MRFYFLCLFVISALHLAAQDQEKLSTESYIELYAEAAVENMKKSGVPASITLAQGILESGSGNSDLARIAKNHFGIKCHTGWTGKTYHMDDDAPNECFRSYEHVLDSYRDHAEFLRGRPRYAALFELPIADYKGWANGLKAAGYATNPKYPELLIGLIERYHLNTYDQPGASVASSKKVDSEKKTTPTEPQTAPKTQGKNSQSYRLIYINGLRAVELMSDFDRSLFNLAFELPERKWLKYNERGPNDALKAGQIVFLEPLRNSAALGTNEHTVQQGDTWHSIAHKYGVKTKALLKKNRAGAGSLLEAGTKVRLR
jgi:LysM repeat protein